MKLAGDRTEQAEQHTWQRQQVWRSFRLPRTPDYFGERDASERPADRKTLFTT
jgi:hypothetical protein